MPLLKTKGAPALDRLNCEGWASKTGFSIHPMFFSASRLLSALSSFACSAT